MFSPLLLSSSLFKPTGSRSPLFPLRLAVRWPTCDASEANGGGRCAPLVLTLFECLGCHSKKNCWSGCQLCIFLWKPGRRGLDLTQLLFTDINTTIPQTLFYYLNLLLLLLTLPIVLSD